MNSTTNSPATPGAPVPSMERDIQDVPLDILSRFPPEILRTIVEHVVVIDRPVNLTWNGHARYYTSSQNHIHFCKQGVHAYVAIMVHPGLPSTSTFAGTNPIFRYLLYCNNPYDDKGAVMIPYQESVLNLSLLNKLLAHVVLEVFFSKNEFFFPSVGAALDLTFVVQPRCTNLMKKITTKFSTGVTTRSWLDLRNQLPNLTNLKLRMSVDGRHALNLTAGGTISTARGMSGFIEAFKDSLVTLDLVGNDYICAWNGDMIEKPVPINSENAAGPYLQRLLVTQLINKNVDQGFPLPERPIVPKPLDKKTAIKHKAKPEALVKTN